MNIETDEDFPNIPCKRCGQISNPSTDSGCPDADNSDCNWFCGHPAAIRYIPETEEEYKEAANEQHREGPNRPR